MNLNIPPIITYLVAWSCTMGGLWALFDLAETVVSKESKKKVTAWIKGLEISRRNEWPKTFMDVVGAVFGRRHFSLRCFFSSSVASFCFVLILAILFMSLNPQTAREVLDETEFFFAIFLGVGILNLFPDYFSLLETRFILRAMTKTSSTLRILILVIADLIFTTAIIVVVFVGVSLIANVSLAEVAKACRLGLEFRAVGEGDMTPGIFIYTTYLTSFWIWLYVITLVIARILVRLARVWSWFKGFLNFAEKPLRCLGFLSMILVTAIYILIPLIRLL